MIPNRFFFVSFLILCECTFLFAQPKDFKDSLDWREEVKGNFNLFRQNPESAIKQIDALIDKSIVLKNDSMELELLSNRFQFYYFQRQDFEKMLNLALGLKKKAIKHENQYYQAIAHRYTAQVYFYNEIYDRAFSELQLALDLLDKEEGKNSEIIIEKANVYIAFANVYNFKKEYYNSLRSLKHALEEHEKLPDPNKRRKGRFLDYSNIAGIYLEINDLDSVIYYAEKSLSIGIAGDFPNQFFINYLVLGNVHKKRNDCEKSLYYYRKAESIVSEKYHLNLESLYQNMSEAFECLGDIQAKEIYDKKLKTLQLTIYQNQNAALRKLVSNQKEEPPLDERKVVFFKSKQLGIIIAIVFSFIIIALIYLFIVAKRKSTTTLNLKKEQTPEANYKISPENYRNLIGLLKENDSVLFILEFKKLYPEFLKKIKEKNSYLYETELELIMLMKLGLSVKEIAQYKYIQPKTIQNRRYEIRKKLNIPSSVELEKWIEEIE